VLADLKLGPAYDGFLFLAEDSRHPPSLRSHHHAELELNLVARGEITYVVRGQRLKFPARTLLWLFPSQEHQLVDRTSDSQYYVAVFKPSLIASACHDPAYDGLKSRTGSGRPVLQSLLAPDAFDFLKNLMARVMEGSLDPDLLNREGGFGAESDFRYQHMDPDGLNAGLRHLMLLAWRMHQSGQARHGGIALHPSILKALETLGDDSWEGDLGDLARTCGVSESHFSRLFARQMGIPLNRYRNSLRLARFWEQLQLPAKPTLLEAALASGFGSYAQFYKVFFAAYGEGPRTCLRGELFPSPADRIPDKESA